MGKTVLLVGAFDTKGAEYVFVKERIEESGVAVRTVDTGVLGEPKGLIPDISADEVARAAGSTLVDLRSLGDRGKAMATMAKGLAALLPQLYDRGLFDGVLGLGGTGGTSVITAGMRALPFGVPKVMVSTAAGGDVRSYVGTKDITMIPSIVDVAGINGISREVFTRAAGAICGMVQAQVPRAADEKPLIAASMFGNTTECVDRCRALLSDRGYEVLVFHCTGVGGKTMEGLTEDGMIEAVLDITTTEWADELCGGVFTAGPHRLEAAGKAGVPHLIVPGCIDMVNFGGLDTVPAHYRERNLYEWNPSVTLMRTNPSENAQLGKVFAEKANAAQGPVAFLMPLKGFSILDSEGGQFWWPEANAAFIDAVKAHVLPGIPVYEIDANINDAEFAERAVELLLEMISRK